MSDAFRIRSGDDFLLVLEALSNSYRLLILDKLGERRYYVSELARELSISRPLLYLHLQKLEQAGLIDTRLELSDDGKAMKYVEVKDFNINISITGIRSMISSLTIKKKGE